MRIDPVTLQVLNNHAQAAAESMAFTLFRTAHSTFVKETEDFTTGLTTPDGMTFASPRDLGATWFIGLDYGNAIRMVKDYRPGDIGITNDPYSGYVCTHSPDLHMWKPIFWEGEIVAFAVGHIHNTDVGGAVPASLSRALTEVHQEGIRIPPAKLYEQGVLNQTLLDVMLTNVRMPEQNWGDLKAQVAAMNTGERKVHEMIAKFGVETFRDGVKDLMDLGEAHARRLIASIPDGDYAFSDYLDEDAPGGVPVRLALTLKIRGDEAVLDFTGSDPQLQSSLNVPTGGAARHILLMVGYTYCLYTLDPTIPLNGGITRPARCIVEEGSILNPLFPAAVGMRSMTCGRLQGVIMGAFQAACPDRLPAGPSGGGPIMNVKTIDNRSGRLIMASIDPVTGGAGGSAMGDGADGSGANNGFLKNTPVEINEVEVPIKILRYGLVPDSGGAGKARGGMATVLEFKVFSPNSVVTARNRDRTRFASWGANGGAAGKTSEFWRNPDSNNPVNLGNTDVVTLDPGDVIRVNSGGGSGWGAPEERDPEAVLFDVRQGKVTVEGARTDYGVVIRDGVVDAEATAEARAAMAAAPRPAGHFRYNAGREAFERVWTPAAYDALHAGLRRLPVHWRYFVKRRVFDRVEQGQAVAEAFRAVVAEFAELRGVLAEAAD
ncbi:MAG: hydantoinase B/oxoprolinase family protein [Thalassobaculales bacterium]